MTKRSILVLWVSLLAISACNVARAQNRIVTVRPDVASPGMNVVVELLAPANQIATFGGDGLQVSAGFELLNASDTNDIIVGPAIVGWNGRVLQLPLFVSSYATPHAVPFRVTTGAGAQLIDTFRIVVPQHIGPINGDIVLGQGFGILSKSNVLVVDSLIASNSRITFALSDPDDAHPGNPRMQPVTLLSLGPVRLFNSTISVDATGLDGGPGGGGGGHGNAGAGGSGFTGGGNSSTPAGPNQGSASEAVDTSGGFAATGVSGGGSENSDQGGGGGTGAPYGSSGLAGASSDTSRAGGYGGGSAGGEEGGQVTAYGGGGGGFGTDGGQGGGFGQNQGLSNGGRFLIPLAGGSGGGAGNALNDQPGAGSGGGGGGALAIVTYDSLIVQSSDITANGDSGTTGVSLTAGGGGGSGGGIYVGAQRGARAEGFSMIARGGLGGSHGIRGKSGGNGGQGRVRFDGASDACAQCQTSAVQASGVSLRPLTGVQAGDQLQLEGAAIDSLNTQDTVRIFYRTRHSGWRFLDTVRYSTPTGRHFQKWIPASNDSVVYAVAYIKVADPSHEPANLEPDWITSPVALLRVRHVATPVLSTLDSLDLGPTRLSHCTVSWLPIQNDGEAALRIDSIQLPSKAFTLLSTLPLTIPGYSRDSLLIQFCPDTAGQYRAALHLFSNAANKLVQLRGVGIQRNDSISFSPRSFDFGKQLLDECDSVIVTITAEGSDTTYLRFIQLTQPPFSYTLRPADSVLPPHSTRQLIVRYCPVDSGLAFGAIALDDRQDTLFARGIGISRGFTSGVGLDERVACAGSINFQDTLINVGNDTLSILSASSRMLALEGPLPIILQPGDHRPIVWKATEFAAGRFRDTIIYSSGDRSDTTYVSLRVRSARVEVPANHDFGYLCLNTCDTSTILITNPSDDSIHIDEATLAVQHSFGVLETELDLGPRESKSIHVTYCSSDTTTSFDSLQLVITSGLCDTVQYVLLHGAGTLSPVATGYIDFDSLLVGECKDDSVLVQNPCGPDVAITALDLPSDFQYLGPDLPRQLPSKSSLYLHIRYCPTVAHTVDTTAALHGTDVYPIILRGVAYSAPAGAFAHFTLVPKTLQSSQNDVIVLRLDSSNMTGSHTLTGSLAYDAQVLVVSSVKAPFSGSETTPGHFEFSGTFMSDASPSIVFDALGLAGSSASTMVTPALQFDTVSVVSAIPGLISIIDCSNLPGNIAVGGQFSIESISHDPRSSSIQVALHLGFAGTVRMQLFDPAGRLVASGDFQCGAGAQTLNAPLGLHPSGTYLMKFSSGPWNATRKFLLFN